MDSDSATLTDALPVKRLADRGSLTLSMVEGSGTASVSVSVAPDLSAPPASKVNLSHDDAAAGRGGVVSGLDAGSEDASPARRRGSSGSLTKRSEDGDGDGHGGHSCEGQCVATLGVDGELVPMARQEEDGGEDGVASVVDRARGLMDFPDEILLHIFSYLDLPDLALLARLSPALAPLTTDPVLHLHRLRIVSPSRVSHGLFARGPHGQPLRPSVGELVQRGVLRGLGIERAWRMGGYWGSARSKLQYENGRAVARRLACSTLATQLRRRAAGGRSSIKTLAVSGLAPAALPRGPTDVRPAAANSLHLLLYPQQVCPDVEGTSPQIARALLPTMRKLKWCLQRDRLARVFKASGVGCGSVGAWLATPAGAERGWRVLVRERDEEKLRLAVCPDIRKARGVFEALASVG